MKHTLLFLLVTLVVPFGAKAQLSKLMSKYHEKNGITVTQLDKSLYALYQRDNLPPEATEMLQKLDEVNLLNVALSSSSSEQTDKLIGQFREVLDNPNKYKLIKSRNDEYGKQLIYTHTQNGKVTDLVVWNQNPEQLDIIELRGDIQLDKIALLTRILNINGLNSLAALSANPNSFESLKRNLAFDGATLSKQMREMAQKLRQQWESGQNRAGEFFGFAPDSLAEGDLPFAMGGMMDPFRDFFGDTAPSDIFENFFGQEGGAHQKIEKFFQSFSNGENIMSNSVQITEENGKTKIKIDSKNSDMTYIIDGKEAPKDNVQMPESILNVNIIPSKEDVKKSYLFITSKDKLGDFTNFKDGVLTFRYNNQEYKYNLDKAQHPLLVIDGRLSDTFDIDPASILQIRPISQIEKEVGYYPNAEVMINTKY